MRLDSASDDLEAFDGWELRRVRAVQASLARMPTAQIAHTLFVSRVPAFQDMLSRVGWKSHYKARHYMASLAMQTSAPANLKFVTLNDLLPAACDVWQLIEDYAYRLHPNRQEAFLASRVFHHRLHNARLIDVEQIRERCLGFFAEMPEVENNLGLSTEKAVAILDHVAEIVERQIESLYQHRPRSRWFRKTRDPLLQTAETLAVSLQDLETSFGDSLHRFLDAFALKRQNRLDRLLFASEIGGPTLTEERPVFVEGDQLFFPDLDALWRALYDRLLRISRAGEASNQLRRAFAENKAASLLRRLFGDSAVYQNVYHKKGGPENDSVVLIGDTIIVVESKGAAAVPPITRHHEANLSRLREHAESDVSPFYGIVQGQRLFQRLDSSEKPITVRHGGQSWETGKDLTLDPRLYRNRFVIAVTLEEYGPLMTDLAIAGLVDMTVGKPWATDLHAFEQFLWGIERRGWDGRDFIVYLEQRAKAHGGMITDDELDFAGYWLQHGNLLPFSLPGMTMQVGNLAAIFDKFWQERRGLATVTFESIPRPCEAPPLDQGAALRQFVSRLFP